MCHTVNYTCSQSDYVLNFTRNCLSRNPPLLAELLKHLPSITADKESRGYWKTVDYLRGTDRTKICQRAKQLKFKLNWKCIAPRNADCHYNRCTHKTTSGRRLPHSPGRTLDSASLLVKKKYCTSKRSHTTYRATMLRCKLHWSCCASPHCVASYGDNVSRRTTHVYLMQHHVCCNLKYGRNTLRDKVATARIITPS